MQAIGIDWVHVSVRLGGDWHAVGCTGRVLIAVATQRLDGDGPVLESGG